MCGIAGFISIADKRPAERELVKRMTDTLKYLGPDSSGYFVAGHAALGCRRLSIIDLETGNQPIYNFRWIDRRYLQW
jgi:asparagine synthetase B (glutamine-hydrolysing)